MLERPSCTTAFTSLNGALWKLSHYVGASIFERPTLSPQKNKPRLYVALCSRDDASFRNNANCDTYLWALLVGPDTAARDAAGTRHHVRHDQGTQNVFCEEQDMDLALAQTIHVRIAFAKVVSVAQLQKTLRNLPLKDSDPTWTCLSWVKLAFQKLVENRTALKGYVFRDDWSAIEARARRYVQEKREQRRTLYLAGITHSIPTWNFWEKRETNQ